MKNKMKNKSGQVAIIVLLASAVLLTIGLSSSRKTITDVKVDTDEGFLKDAFNAAESGINNYLNSKDKNYSIGSSGAGASVNVVTIGNGTSLSSESLILPGSSQLFWLVNHKENGDIGGTYYSGNYVQIQPDSDFRGALKIDYFYKISANYFVSRVGYRYDNLTKNEFNNGFITPENLPTSGDDSLLLVITPIGGSTKLTLISDSGKIFPSQGEELTSVGTAGNGIKTQIKTRHSYQTLPPFFMESMTAGGTIKNN